jgi:hypothetical protein
MRIIILLKKKYKKNLRIIILYYNKLFFLLIQIIYLLIHIINLYKKMYKAFTKKSIIRTVNVPLYYFGSPLTVGVPKEIY